MCGWGHFNSKFLHTERSMKYNLSRQFNCTNPLVSSRCRPVRWVHLWAGAKGFAIAQTFRVCVTWQIWIWVEEAMAANK